MLPKSLSDTLDLDVAAAVVSYLQLKTHYLNKDQILHGVNWDEATKLAMENKITISRKRPSRQCKTAR